MQWRLKLWSYQTADFKHWATHKSLKPNIFDSSYFDKCDKQTSMLNCAFPFNFSWEHTPNIRPWLWKKQTKWWMPSCCGWTTAMLLYVPTPTFCSSPPVKMLLLLLFSEGYHNISKVVQIALNCGSAFRDPVTQCMCKLFYVHYIKSTDCVHSGWLTAFQCLIYQTVSALENPLMLSVYRLQKQHIHMITPTGYVSLNRPHLGKTHRTSVDATVSLPLKQF